MADVFLSYKRTPERRRIVSRLALTLTVHGVSVWWDDYLEAGTAFAPDIDAELNNARLIIPLWCWESVRSKWVLREARRGLDLKTLLPARLQQVDPPEAFAAFQAADLIGWDGHVRSEKLRAFLDIVGKRLERPVRSPVGLIEDLERLPPLDVLPDLPFSAFALLRALQTYHMETTGDGLQAALDIGFQSPLSALVGEYLSQDEATEEISRIIDEISDWQNIKDLELADWDFEEIEWQDVQTVGELIQLMIGHSAPVDVRSHDEIERLVAEAGGFDAILAAMQKKEG